MFTSAFWRAALERALKSGAQFGLAAAGQDLVDINLFQANWENVLVTFAAGVGLSVLTSLASAQIGTKGSPSLAAEAEVEAATS